MRFLHDIYVSTLLRLEKYFRRYAVITYGPTFLVKPGKLYPKPKQYSAVKARAIQAWYQVELAQLEAKKVDIILKSLENENII